MQADAYARAMIEHALTLLPEKMRSPLAVTLLHAIAIQESDLRFRRQMPTGPARSLWQIEPQTAAAVLNNSQWIYAAWLDFTGTMSPTTPGKRWSSVGNTIMQTSDIAGCLLARGILWLDPHPLPSTYLGGWSCYLRTWRPGKPRAETWAEAWRRADA